MPKDERRTRSRLELFLCGLGLAASFVLFDRLIFFGLRAGAARYYETFKADKLPWAGTVGEGEGRILVMGTSRAYRGIDEEILASVLNKKASNEARPGSYPEYNYYFYQNYKKEFGPPSLVIYGLDYFIFEKNSAGMQRVHPEVSSPLVKRDPEDVVNPASPWLSRVSRLYRFKPEIDEFFADFFSSGRLDGDETGSPENPETSAKTDLPTHQKRRFKIPRGVTLRRPPQWPKRFYNPFPGKEGPFLVRLLEDLGTDGVPVFLVFIPDYIGSYETNIEQDKFKDDIRRLSKARKNTLVLDFNRPDHFDLGDPRLFWNGGWGISNCHLNPQGAAVFTRKLALDITKALEAGFADHQ